MPRRLAALAAVLVCLLLAPAAFAEATNKIALRLDYQPPAEGDCPSAEALALMLAGEFGYTVVRTDVSPVLHVEIKRSRKGLEAEITGPSPTGDAEAWHGKTDPRGTCGELSYDIAYTVKLGLGPSAWGSEEPPPSLAAPADLEVARPWLGPMAPRPPGLFASLLPRVPAANMSSAPQEADSVTVEAGLGVVVLPYGLPSVAIGGNALLAAVRWPRFALGGELRAVVTPAAGIGDRNFPARTALLTGTLLPCAATRWFDLCGAVSIGSVAFLVEEPAKQTVSDGLTVGFGGRVTGRWTISAPYTVLFFGDALADIRRTAFASTRNPATQAPVLDWLSPPVRIGLGVALAIALPK